MRREVIIIAAAIWITGIVAVYAQGGPPPDPDNIPLDPLSWIILAGGGAIGVKKFFFDKKKEKN